MLQPFRNPQTKHRQVQFRRFFNIKHGSIIQDLEIKSSNTAAAMRQEKQTHVLMDNQTLTLITTTIVEKVVKTYKPDAMASRITTEAAFHNA